MKNFKIYYSEKQIISLLCKIRVSYAEKRNKIQLLNDLTSKGNHVYFEGKIVPNSYDDRMLKQLNEIMPPRRLWVTLNHKELYENKYNTKYKTKLNLESKKKLNTNDKNKKCLIRTINLYRNKYPEFKFVKKLNDFLADIIFSIENNSFNISPLDIFPEIKQTSKYKFESELRYNGVTECRPISRFELKDRIVLSITNKFFTKLFDGFFEESSLAFRLVESDENKKNHHTAIKKIIEEKSKYPNQNLFVSECDIKKFYDSVNHKICIEAFNKLIVKSKKKYSNLDLAAPSNIFYEYLKCYSFQDNILSKNGNAHYWKGISEQLRKNIVGFYPWIQSDISGSLYYKTNTQDKIGIPQGGALSGLIANIVLDEADKRLKLIDNLFYIRYCDDMIIMHTNEEICKKAIDTYIETITSLNLFNHPFPKKYFNENPLYDHHSNGFPIKNGLLLKRNYKNSIKNYWNLKTKGPYQWGEIDLSKQRFPWIGFVGYEIHYNCDTRIRKRSLKKEIEKQKRIGNNIYKAIKRGKVVSNQTILKSAYEKLNGMSIGRVDLYNYKNCSNDMCWTHGFQHLTFNSYSKRQLKILDRSKYKVIYKLKKKWGDEIDNPKKTKDKNNNEIISYHKPFSYFFQAGEKKHKK